MCFKKYLIPWNTACSSGVYHSHQNCPYETGIRIMPNQMHQCNQRSHNAKYLETLYTNMAKISGEHSGPQPETIQKTVLQIT